MWFFYSPGIIYGEDALDFLENIPGEKCFIVTDKVLGSWLFKNSNR